MGADSFCLFEQLKWKPAGKYHLGFIQWLLQEQVFGHSSSAMKVLISAILEVFKHQVYVVARHSHDEVMGLGLVFPSWS